MTRKMIFLLALLLPLLSVSVMTRAQDNPAPAAAEKAPALPPALATLAQQGAQMRYLGRALGFDGWIAIRNGQVEYFYVSPDGNAILTGLLMDKQGHLVTAQQVKALQEKSGKDIDPILQKMPDDQAADAKKDTTPAFKTPAEQLYEDVESSNWLTLGSKDAPFIYTFIDPQCPHCHDMLKDLHHAYIENGLLQVRIIPIGFRDETKAQAAFLLASPDAQARLFKYIDGDNAALPVTPGINEQGVERNLAIMQSWKFDVTPLTIYRAADGKVKIVRGRVQDIAALLADLPKKQ